LIVERRDDENAERLIGRFRQVIQRSGILRDAKKKRFFVSKSEARRVARARSIRRLRKKAQTRGQDNHGPRGGRGDSRS
jgi:ribosomal protein S21